MTIRAPYLCLSLYAQPHISSAFPTPVGRLFCTLHRHLGGSLAFSSMLSDIYNSYHQKCHPHALQHLKCRCLKWNQFSDCSSFIPWKKLGLLEVSSGHLRCLSLGGWCLNPTYHLWIFKSGQLNSTLNARRCYSELLSPLPISFHPHVHLIPPLISAAEEQQDNLTGNERCSYPLWKSVKRLLLLS